MSESGADGWVGLERAFARQEARRITDLGKLGDLSAKIRIGGQALELTMRVVSDPLDNAASLAELADDPGDWRNWLAVLPFIPGGFKKLDELADSGKMGDRVADAYRTAKKKLDSAGPNWKIARHGDMPSPRPSGYQSHHGVNSVWADANFQGYLAEDAPAVLMKNNPYHNATRGVFNRIRAEVARNQGVSVRNIDWSKVSAGTAWRLSEEQFEKARVPQAVRDAYFRAFNEYLESLR